MTNEKFQEAVCDEVRTCLELLLTKGKEYSGDRPEDDRLVNFKLAAGLARCTEKQALFGMLCKHLASLSEMIMTNGDYSEARWKEKITDSINYLLILYAMVKEEMKWTK